MKTGTSKTRLISLANMLLAIWVFFWVQGHALAAEGAVTSQSNVDTATPKVNFTTLDFDWQDTNRNRLVPVRLYLPDAASAARPAPLIVFSHGIGGSRNGYTYLGKYWANQGFASLHLQHVGSDRSLWFGNPLTLAERLQNAAQDNEAIARVQDHHFALDRLLIMPDLAQKIDHQRVVAAGHSYGANTTMLVVGATVERNGRLLNYGDPRVKAAIILSAPPFYGSGDPVRILGNVLVPTLHITATEDVIRIPGYFSGSADRIAIYDSMSATSGAKKVLAVFEGGSHGVFTDRAGTGGVTLNLQVKEATRQLSLAFMRNLFDADESSLVQWQQQFSSILAQFTMTSQGRQTNKAGPGWRSEPAAGGQIRSSQ